MTKNQIQLLNNYYFGEISKEQFLQAFGKEIENIEFIKNEIQEAILTKTEDTIEQVIKLIWLTPDIGQYIDELNILLLEPNHRSHQVLTKEIQGLANPKSVPFIKKVLDSNFDYLEYTCSESAVIAKWFSWALFSIGTEEAINLIKEYAKSEEEGIRSEMNYRLNKMNAMNN